MGIFTAIAQHFQHGGIFMFLILIVLGVGVGIAVERFIYLRKTKSTTQKIWSQLAPKLIAHDLDAVRVAIEKKSKTALSVILGYGLDRLPTAQRREDIESAMEEGLMEVVPLLEQRTHYLATFANIATLLGLLGTIVGLIDAFNAVAQADPSEKAQLLSESISLAMNTTAFGLIAAIPLLLIHTVLHSMTTRLVDSLEMATVKCLNMITRGKPKQQ